jgi:tetratricopeptide (TPR) repeat protein
MLRRNTYLVTLSILLLGSNAFAQNCTIRGKVRSTAGAVLDGAIVELRMAGGAGVLGQTATHADGDFVFSGLAAREYDVAVSMGGYEPAVQVVRFNHTGEHFQEVINIEITVRPTSDPLLAGPGTSFAQDVPRAARASYERGVAMLAEGKSTEGLELLREATGLFDQYFDAHFRLGVELYRTGRMKEALDSLERARQINDRDSGVYRIFGLVMFRQQKFAVAEYAFAEAIRLAPNSVTGHFHRGQALVEIAVRLAGDKQKATKLWEAEKELKLALDLSGKKLAAAHLSLARIHEIQNDKEASIRDLESYLKIDSGSKQSAAVREALIKLREQKD